MQNIEQQLEQLYSVCHIPMILMQRGGVAQAAWPSSHTFGVKPFAFQAVLEDFCLQKRDAQHPLINFFGSGFLFGLMELSEEYYLLIGLVSPYYQSRKDILIMLTDVIEPTHLQRLCDSLTQMPLMTLQQMKDYICLLGKLLLSQEILPENISFMDILSQNIAQVSSLEEGLFFQREEPDFHISVDFETAICNAIESGNKAQLERCLNTPTRGRVGRMSSNDLRQQKYSVICMATLASRAAIRGGLPSETAFSLSDLYCQRVDLLSDIQLLQNMTYTMLVDYCDRVQKIQNRPSVSSVIQKCISYISVHLHEPVSLEQLSRHCGLCGRSLSLRFKKEMGMGIPEYMHREKLQEAEYLLRHSSFSLSEITSFLNYPSQSYFTQIFKKYKNLTPQQFRDSKA